MQADRFNSGKPEYSLIDYASLEPMVRVLMYGCKKYSRDNWKKGLPVTETIDSMLRHVYRLLSGERIDAESGEQHIGHILCNAMFISHALNFNKEFDNLPQNETQDTELSHEFATGTSNDVRESCGHDGLIHSTTPLASLRYTFGPS